MMAEPRPETTVPAERQLIQPIGALDAIAAAALASSNPRMIEMVVEERRAQRRAMEAQALQQQQEAAQARLQAESQRFSRDIEAKRAAAEESRFGREAAATTEFRKSSLDLEQQRVDIAKGEAESTAAARVAEAELRGREAMGKAIDETLGFYRRLSAPTAAAGVKLDPKDILGAMGAAGQGEIFAIAHDERLDEAGKIKAVMALLTPVASGIAGAISAATGGIQSPDSIIGEASRILVLQTLRVPKEFQREFLAQLSLATAPIDEATAKVKAGEVESMTPEEELQFRTEAAGKLATSMRSGYMLSRTEQELWAKYWRGTKGLPAKAEALEKTLAVAINGIAVAEGFDEAQTTGLYQSVYDAIVSIVDNEDARAVAEVIVPRDPRARVHAINTELGTLREQIRKIREAPNALEVADELDEMEKRAQQLERSRVELRKPVVQAFPPPGVPLPPGLGKRKR